MNTITLCDCVKLLNETKVQWLLLKEIHLSYEISFLNANYKVFLAQLSDRILPKGEQIIIFIYN